MDFSNLCFCYSGLCFSILPVISNKEKTISVSYVTDGVF